LKNTGNPAKFACSYHFCNKFFGRFSMGIVFRQSVKSFISIFAGAALGALTIYLSTLYIPKQELGFRNTLVNLAVAGAQVFLFGTHNLLSVYIHRYGENDQRKTALVSMTMILPVLFFLIGSLIYFPFKEQIIGLAQPEDQTLFIRFFNWLPPFVLLFGYQMLFETYLISQHKTAKAHFLREVLLRILNIVAIIFFGYTIISYAHLIYATVLFYLIPIGIMLALSLRESSFRIHFAWNVFSREEKKEMVHFTWYHSLLGISTTLLGTLDALMLASLSPHGLRSVAIYNVAVFIVSFLQMPYRSMLTASFPILNKVYLSGDQNELRSIFLRSSMNILIASVAMLLLIVSNLSNATRILPGGYEGIVPVVLVLLIGRMVDLATGMNDQLLSISGFYKYNFYISILLVLLLVVFNRILIPIYDAVGAASAATLALVIYNILKYAIVRRMLKIQPFSTKSVLVLLAGTGGLMFGLLLPELSNPYLDVFYRSPIVLIVFVVLLIMLRPSEDFNQYVAEIRKNKRLF